MSEATALGIVQQLATLGKGTAQVVHVEVFVDLFATPLQTGAVLLTGL